MEPVLTEDLDVEEDSDSGSEHYILGMLEVLSVCITDFRGDLYGSISVTDGWGIQFLYDRKKEQYQSIGPDNNTVLLTGPTRPILTCDSVILLVNLIDKDRDLPVFCGGMEWNAFPPNIDVSENPRYEDPWREEGCGSVRVNYMALSDAVAATVTVTLIIRDGEEVHPAHVYGTITACNSSISDESVLFQQASNESMDVMSGKLIPLSRSIVAVPYYSSLIVRVNLQDSNSSDVIAKGTAQFLVEPSGEFEKRIEKRTYCQRHEIRVNVTFDIPF